MLAQRFTRRLASKKPFSRSLTSELKANLGIQTEEHVAQWTAMPKRWTLSSRGKLQVEFEVPGESGMAVYPATREDVPAGLLAQLDSKLKNRIRVPGDCAAGSQYFLDPAKPVPRPSLRRSERLKSFVPGPAFFPWRNEQVVYMKVNAGYPTWHFIQEKWYFDRLYSWINDKVARWSWDPGMKWFDKGLFEWLGPAGMKYVGSGANRWIARRMNSLNMGFLILNCAMAVSVMGIHAWAVTHWLPQDESVLEHFKKFRGKNIVFDSSSGDLSDFRMSDSA